MRYSAVSIAYVAFCYYFFFLSLYRRLQARRSGGRHLVHLQVDVGGPRLGVRWGVVGIGGIVLQAATLLQVGLELLTAPPAGQGEKKRIKKKKKGSGVRG